MPSGMWGAALTGLAKGFQDYQQGQEDLAYTRQLRANQLASQQLANQDQQMRIAATRKALNDADLENQLAKQGLKDSQDTSAGVPSEQSTGFSPYSASTTSNNSSGNTLAGIQRSGLSMDKLASLDQKYGLPTGTMYGTMLAESGGNSNSVSKSGAVGLFQVLPSTAASPGYGLESFDPKNPEGAAAYLGKMNQMAGGDIMRASAMYNAGPKGNANNPETQNYIKKVDEGRQHFAAAYDLDQSKQGLSPAEQISVRENSGSYTPISDYQKANAEQDRRIKYLTAAGDRATAVGRPDIAGNFYDQADKLRDQQLELQGKAIDVQGKANKQVSDLANGVHDQASLNNFFKQLDQNPAMKSVVAGLDLTHDFNLDRNKISNLANRAETIKDQHLYQLKKQEQQIKQEQEERARRKDDEQNNFVAQAKASDDARRDDLTGKGILWAPSLAASLPKGTTPAQLIAAKKDISRRNDAFDKAHDAAFGGAAQLAADAARVYTDVKNGNVTVGGPFVSGQTFFAEHTPLGNAAYSAKQQELIKATNSMVLAMQNMAKSAGGGASASTAAMAKRFESAKPNISQDQKAFEAVAHGLYVASSMQKKMQQFIDETSLSNPDTPKEVFLPQWRRYERALGLPEIIDPQTNQLVPNMAGVEFNEDGSKNEGYLDYHIFFGNNGKF
jgi:soluble lytic murein transglycosylase-like protein